VHLLSVSQAAGSVRRNSGSARTSSARPCRGSRRCTADRYMKIRRPGRRAAPSPIFCATSLQRTLALKNQIFERVYDKPPVERGRDVRRGAADHGTPLLPHVCDTVDLPGRRGRPRTRRSCSKRNSDRWRDNLFRHLSVHHILEPARGVRAGRRRSLPPGVDDGDGGRQGLLDVRRRRGRSSPRSTAKQRRRSATGPASFGVTTGAARDASAIFDAVADAGTAVRIQGRDRGRADEARQSVRRGSIEKSARTTRSMVVRSNIFRSSPELRVAKACVRRDGRVDRRHCLGAPVRRSARGRATLRRAHRRSHSRAGHIRFRWRPSGTRLMIR